MVDIHLQKLLSRTVKWREMTEQIHRRAKQPSQMACSSKDLKGWGAWNTTCGHKTKDSTASIAWRREAWKEAALDDLPWKDKRGPSSISLELFQRQWNFWETGRSAYGIFRAHINIPSWTVPGTLGVELFNHPAFGDSIGGTRKRRKDWVWKVGQHVQQLQTLRRVAQSSWARANSRLKSRSVSLWILGFWGADGCSCRGGCVSQLTEEPLLRLTPRVGSATDAAPLACERA